MSAERVVYSIQRTYILNSISMPEKRIITCDQRIDIPTIEPLTEMKALVYQDEFSKIIPCIELKGRFLDEFKLEFETNDGITVLPVEIYPGTPESLDNPYMSFRYVLVLPRGTTGIKSCKLIQKATRKEVQHNLTFGIMPPPYNYDNALFGVLSYRANSNHVKINNLEDKVAALENKTDNLKLTAKTPTFENIQLPKGAGKQTINIEPGVLFFTIGFSYPSSTEGTIHNPKITLHGSDRHLVYTLSLNRSTNTVSIDLFTGMLTVYAGPTGEIFQQFVVPPTYRGFEKLIFENFDDINTSYLYVTPRGARVI